MQSSEDAAARMDTWMIVYIGDGPSLFGFVLRHPVTGGLAWTLTSPLSETPRAGRARTQDGVTYELGDALDPCEAFHSERLGPEGAAAYHLLVHPETIDPAARYVIEVWLTARKMARWLGVQPPDHTRFATIESWIKKHRDEYHLVRSTGHPWRQ